MLYSATTKSITELPMAEPHKRKKIKPTWSDVKAKVGEFDKAGLIQLVAELYSFHKDNQSFLHARFALGPNPLDDYRKKIAVALAPDVHGKRDGKISVAEAKKAISAYNKAVGDPKGILELRLFWCETAVQFSMDFGYADEGYFDALVIQYRAACQGLSVLDEPLLENTIERLSNIRDDAQMGYGVGDYMGEVLGEALLNLPTPQIEARVPQLDD
jgi:hypothetical protein